MREMLFRGKRTDNGEWVEGWLNKYGNDFYIDDCSVIPETVGEYTRFTDKNETKIFEHDIVRLVANVGYIFEFVGVVCIGESGSFVMCPESYGGRIIALGSKYEDVGHGYYNFVDYEIEVIGNTNDAKRSE